MIHSADVREWRDCAVLDAKGHRIGALKKDPALGTDDVLPAEEEAIFQQSVRLSHGAPPLRSSGRNYPPTNTPLGLGPE
ncbi:hypothetical protein [Streptomyces katrae]|uniref:hypothetical protein n=1 Tax=Streptomyces katrae TaxID=68223 RepID=UPI001F252B5C|nr:hypothetical protein [Streptomyces katrae]